MNSFVKKIKNFVFHNKLFSKGDRILIGISGGPDSVCLSRVFLEMKKAYELDLALFHVNYGLRGADSESDEEFVRKFAKEHGLKLEVVNYTKDQNEEGNLEEKMRDFRYSCFEEFAKKEGFDKIALAHNSNDQTETFLMNMFRGSGTKGLSAMKPKRGMVIRPLLFVSKKEILKYLAEDNQSYRIDKSNLSQEYTRNRIRNSLVPVLEEYNPRLLERIYDLTEHLRDETSIVEEIIEKKYNDIVQKKQQQYRILVTELLEVSVGVRKLLFRKIIKDLKGDLKNISNGNFFEFNKIAESIKSKTQTCLIGEIVIFRSGNEITISKKID